MESSRRRDGVESRAVSLRGVGSGRVWWVSGRVGSSRVERSRVEWSQVETIQVKSSQVESWSGVECS